MRSRAEGSVGEYDVSDADTEAFCAEALSGSGGVAPKGAITAELFVEFCNGKFTCKGFVPHAGLEAIHQEP